MPIHISFADCFDNNQMRLSGGNIICSNSFCKTAYGENRNGPSGWASRAESEGSYPVPGANLFISKSCAGVPPYSALLQCPFQGLNHPLVSQMIWSTNFVFSNTPFTAASTSSSCQYVVHQTPLSHPKCWTQALRSRETVVSSTPPVLLLLLSTVSSAVPSVISSHISVPRFCTSLLHVDVLHTVGFLMWHQMHKCVLWNQALYFC